MKTYKNIYSKMLDKDYIKIIIEDSIKGKSYRYKVTPKINAITDNIYNYLSDRKYPMLPTRERVVTERSKPRKIIVSPYYTNKVFDYLVVDGIKDIITKSMYKWCVGNVKGRGKDVGLYYIEKHVKHYKYAIKLDIKKFYENIDKRILYNKLAKKISDKDFMHMYSSVIGSHGKGIPLGLNSSQWLSNFYLQSLDYYIKQELKADIYARYVDDMVILGNNKRKLHYFIKQIGKYLNDKLNLGLKENYQLLNLDKGDMIDWLGYRVGKQTTLLKKKTFYRFVRLYMRMAINPSKKRAKTVISLNGWMKRLKYYFKYYTNYLQKYIKFKDIIKIKKGEFNYELATN